MNHRVIGEVFELRDNQGSVAELTDDEFALLLDILERYWVRDCAALHRELDSFGVEGHSD